MVGAIMPGQVALDIDEELPVSSIDPELCSSGVWRKPPYVWLVP